MSMDRVVRASLCLAGAWLALYEAHILGLSWVPTGDVETLHLVVLAIGGSPSAARAFARRDERLPWALIGAGMLAWTAGEVYYTRVLWDDASPPIPSPAAPRSQLLPVLVFAGGALPRRARVSGLSRTLWVDALTAAPAVGSLSAAV